MADDDSVDQAEVDRQALEDFEAAEGMLSGMNVITITFDTNAPGPPEVDLGGTNPHFAALLFSRIAEALADTTPWPRISFRGDVIFQTHVCGPECFEPDDDDFGGGELD